MSARSLIGRVVLAALAAGALTACKKDPEPAAKPAGSESASSVSTPSEVKRAERSRPSLPVMPRRRPDLQPGQPGDSGPPGMMADGERPTREEMLARRDARRQEMLEMYDADHDGQLSDDERHLMHEARMSGVVQRLDDDGDGRLSRTELSEMRTSARRPMPDFDTLDTDKDGFISVEELAAGRPARGPGDRGGPRDRAEESRGQP